MTTNDPVDINWPEEMDETEREELRGLLAAYDQALKDFDADHRVVFASDSDRLRKFHAFLKKSAKEWSKPGLCMHDGCTKTSIARSHTIPLSSSIRLIAENNHVVTPQFRDGAVELVSVGVREASTFPGFCEEHEALFADFETKKKMTEAGHFQLQAFRTICREIYAKRHHRRRAEELLADYRRLREEFVMGRVKEAHRGTKPLQLDGLRFQDDPIEAQFVDALNDIQTDLPLLEGLYRSIINEFRNRADEIAILVESFDIQLPVCLSGIGVLNYMEKGEKRRALCFLAIIPEAGCTKIMLGGAMEHLDILKLHTADKTSPAVLERLESWMIYGSDHWFMTPSAWAEIPEARQKTICDTFLETLSLADLVPFSILDRPRKRLIAYIEGELARGGLSKDELSKVQAVLEHEIAKLTYAPSTDER